MSSLVAYIYYNLLRCIHSSSRQHNRTYRSQFMTSTYLHANCVVGVACAEAFANKNIAPRRQQTDVKSSSAIVTYCDAACIGGFEFSPLLHMHIYLSANSIITKKEYYTIVQIWGPLPVVSRLSGSMVMLAH